MEHKISPENQNNSFILIKEHLKDVEIQISNNGNYESTILTTKELHSFIGTLLHVQAKLKK